MTEKNEALLLADELEIWTLGEPAAAELRRLRAENAVLHERHRDDNVEYTRVLTQRDALLALLGNIRGWDMFDRTADGTFWKREIDAAIKQAKE